jgi:hypothetical protein
MWVAVCGAWANVVKACAAWLSPVPGIGAAHDRARARLVAGGAEAEGDGHGAVGRAGLAKAIERPSGHRAGQFGHVGLGIARAHAQRVEFHDLAREVLVEAGGLASRCCGAG